MGKHLNNPSVNVRSVIITRNLHSFVSKTIDAISYVQEHNCDTCVLYKDVNIRVFTINKLLLPVSFTRGFQLCNATLIPKCIGGLHELLHKTVKSMMQYKRQ